MPLGVGTVKNLNPSGMKWELSSRILGPRFEWARWMPLHILVSLGYRVLSGYWVSLGYRGCSLGQLVKSHYKADVIFLLVILDMSINVL